MNKISTHLWFDKEAKEAANFYVSVFNGAKITHSSLLHDTPSGDVDLIIMDIWDQEFTLISAGPLFKFTPAVSFAVACKNKEEVDELWKKLVEGGSVLMELGSYPFNEHYGWLADKYGVTWQIMVAMGPAPQKITPTLMFVGDMAGKTKEAVEFYTSLFKNSKIGHSMQYGKGEEPDKEGTMKYLSFTLAGQDFAAMDSAHEHKFTFSEAISFVVHCENQEEVDYFWEKLSVVSESEQCGWLKDKYGFSWQIEPIALRKMMQDKDPEKVARVTQAFLKMKKFDIAALEKVYNGS